MINNANSVTANPNPGIPNPGYPNFPSLYHGISNSPLLFIPRDILNLIAQTLAEQKAALPLRFVCKATRDLDALKPEKLKNERTRDPIKNAIERGFSSLAQWFHEHLRYPIREEAVFTATEKVNMQMLFWLQTKGHLRGSLGEAVYLAAAKGGHALLLQWALAYVGGFLKAKTCANAAEGGHLEVLQWLRSKGCPWDVIGDNYSSSHPNSKILRFDPKIKG